MFVIYRKAKSNFSRCICLTYVDFAWLYCSKNQWFLYSAIMVPQLINICIVYLFYLSIFAHGFIPFTNRCKSASVQGNCCPTDEGVSWPMRVLGSTDWVDLFEQIVGYHFLWLYNNTNNKQIQQHNNLHKRGRMLCRERSSRIWFEDINDSTTSALSPPGVNSTTTSLHIFFFTTCIVASNTQPGFC